MKTVSLELSQELKACGYPQEDSQFKYCGGHTYYVEDQDKGEFEECENTDLLGGDEYCHTAGLVCEFTLASPTCDEVLEKLPRIIDRKGKRYSLMIFFPTNFSMKDEVMICYQEGDWDHGFQEDYDCIASVLDTSLADAAARCWLYLKQNGLLEV